MELIKPPMILDQSRIRNKTIFLAGSIEMGKAVDWQSEFVNAFSDVDCTILSPRRDNWDPSWEQSINNSQFRYQVEWELKGLHIADVIAMYLDPNTISPISLLELGLYAKDRKMIVCCPEGYFRKGNVDIVCNWYSIKQVNNLVDLIKNVKEIL